MKVYSHTTGLAVKDKKYKPVILKKQDSPLKVMQ